MGLSYSPYSLLTDTSLDAVVNPCSQFMHDWMHGLFSSGVFNVLMCLLLCALEDGGIKDVYSVLHEETSHWRWPWRLRNAKLNVIFEPKRRAGDKENCNFRAQASEGLSIYRVLRCWLILIVLPRNIASAACHAFVAFAALVDCFSAIARGGVSPERLRDAVHAFLARFVAAFGESALTPKFHWLLHYARELWQHSTLLACWVHERKHKTIRRYATNVHKTLRNLNIQCWRSSPATTSQP